MGVRLKKHLATTDAATARDLLVVQENVQRALDQFKFGAPVTADSIAPGTITGTHISSPILAAAKYKASADQSTGTSSTPRALVFATKSYDGQNVMTPAGNGLMPSSNRYPWRFRVRLRIEGVTPGTSWRAVVYDTGGTITNSGGGSFATVPLLVGEECRVFTDEQGTDVAIAELDESSPVKPGHIYSVQAQSVSSYGGGAPVYRVATVKADYPDPRGAGGSPITISGSFVEVLPIFQ